MFPKNYFPASYFAPVYFPPVVAIIVPVVRRDGGPIEIAGERFDIVTDDNEIIEFVAIILMVVD